MTHQSSKEAAHEFYEHIERVVANITMPPVSESNKQAFIENQAATLEKFAQRARLEALVRKVSPTVEFYLKREIRAPANHQEFAREAQEKLDDWRKLEAALRQPPASPAEKETK